MSLKRYYSDSNYSSREVDVLPRPLSKRRRSALGTVSNPIDLTLEEHQPTLYERLQAVERQQAVRLPPAYLTPVDRLQVVEHEAGVEWEAETVAMEEDIQLIEEDYFEITTRSNFMTNKVLFKFRYNGDMLEQLEWNPLYM